MASESATASTASPTLQAAQVYGMAAVCLVAGLAIGYLFHGPRLSASSAPPVAVSATASAPKGAMGAGHLQSLEEIKHLADKQAAPLLEKLKSDPNNIAVLSQVGAIYHTSHQFKEAAACYARAVEVDPKNVTLRTKLASSLYRSGNADAAIAQLNEALKYDPKDANSLFDLGMIRLQGKRDSKGALAAWQQLLKTNPQLSADRRAEVLRLMADVMNTLSDQHGIKGAGSNDRAKSNSYE